MALASLIALWPLLATSLNRNLTELNTTLTHRLKEIDGKLEKTMMHYQEFAGMYMNKSIETSTKFEELANQLKVLDVEFQAKLDEMQANVNSTFTELREMNIKLEKRLEELTARFDSSIAAFTTVPDIATTPVPTTAETLETTSAPIARVSDCSQTQGEGVFILDTGEEIFCSFGWTVFQRRMDGSIPDFHLRNWEEYASGFGNFSGEFWLGLRKLHDITRQGGCRLRADLKSYENETAYAEYSVFELADESDIFRITVDGYNGTAGDALRSPDAFTSEHDINGMAFTTVDNDNDAYDAGNCATYADYGGWWHNRCASAFPNAIYGQITNSWSAIVWYQYKGRNALQATTLKVRCDVS